MNSATNRQTGPARQGQETHLLPDRISLVLTSTMLALTALGAPVRPAVISLDQIGAVAGKQYHGDGLSIVSMPDGVRLRCAFQKLEGQATMEGLWLASTANASKGERFRVLARSVGRESLARSTNTPFGLTPGDHRPAMEATSQSMPATWCAQPLLPRAGKVEVAEGMVRFVRPGLIEEYSVSVDGVRQDFIVAERPAGEGPLRLGLEVTGAKAEARVNGVRLVLDGSGRRIAYSRLRATDAQANELNARIELASAPGEMNRLAVVVDDSRAAYPIRVDPTFSDENWSSLGPLPGADYPVRAAAVDSAGNLYIGGVFSAVGNVVASRVAKWDGHTWSTLGSGMNGTVYALAVSGTDLYAGGSFTTAGGSAANRIAKWNGSTWSALGSGMDNTVQVLLVSGTNLYAGGSFNYVTNAGPTALNANRIAKWNGSTWSALGLGLSGSVSALAVSGSDLYVGGSFIYATNAGPSTVSANYIARWNGSTWSALGSGMDNSSVQALAVSGTVLYAGGYFSTAGGIPARGIAKWNGSTWSALSLGGGGGYYPYVYSLAVSGTDLYVGGDFYYATNAGPTTFNTYFIAKWNGSAWSALTSGMNDNVRVLAVSGTDLFAGGNFTVAGGSAANHIAKWNGSAWSALGSGLGSGLGDGRVYAVAVSGTDLYAGGMFGGPGGSMANHVAKWNGSEWSPLGLGMNANVFALASSGTDLYAGGYFSYATNAGPSAVRLNYIAKWNGSSWSALDVGMNSEVDCLAQLGTDLYAGGYFTYAGGKPANRIAKWNGSAWSAVGLGLGSGSSPTVSALTVSGTNLYAGGSFTYATNTGPTAVRVNYVAQWNGSTWSALGSGLGGGSSPSVYALAASGPDLYAGGYFTYATNTGPSVVSANHVARWNGSTWSALGLGMSSTVYALAVSGTDLYAGGSFAYATNTGSSAVTVNNLARWNGNAWSALGSGLGGSLHTVRALAVSGADLYAGGDFSIAGGNVSAYAARADISMFTPPQLTFTRSANQIGLSWPSSYTTAILESSPALGTGAHWTTIPNSGNSVWVPLGSGNQFFRLRVP